MPRARGELAARLERSLETGDRDAFVLTVESHQDVSEMWEILFRTRGERDAAAAQLREVQALLAQGSEIVPVLEVPGDGYAIVIKRGALHRVNLSHNGNPEDAVEARPGTALVLDEGEHVAVASLGDYRWANDVGCVNYVMEDRRRASVDVNGREHVLHLHAALGDNGGIPPGTRVLCSIGDRLIQGLAPQEARRRPYESQNRIPPGYGLRGIDPAVRARIQREIVMPLSDYAAYGKPGQKIAAIFSGPTGGGKTYAGDQIAAMVPGCALVRRWPTDFRHPVFGMSGRSVRALSDEIAALSLEGPTVVMFEEADVFLARRTEVYGSVQRTELSIESEVFRLFDHLPTDRPVALIATTNLCRTLEPAVLRRFGYRVLDFGYLAPPQVGEVLDSLIEQESTAVVVEDRPELVRRGTERLCDRGQPVIGALVDGARREWTIADLVSPSMIASIVNAAVSEARCGDEDPRLDWPLLATHIHRSYGAFARLINRENIAEYLPELRERRVSEVISLWPREEPVEAYLAA